MKAAIKKIHLLSYSCAFIFAYVSMPIQATTIYANRTNFESHLSTIVIDGYDHTGYTMGDQDDFLYLDRHSDAHMSSILGETRYTATGWTNVNLIVTQDVDALYCAGCNGSFLLDFTSTSVGDNSGVYGVGIDIFEHVGSYYAFVTFGDNSFENYLVSDELVGFWGVTSDLTIRSIHFGLINGDTTIDGAFAIDNLTIGASAIPVPAAIWLFGSGLIGLIGIARRKKPYLYKR